METDIESGTVKWFDRIKGFGFISRDGERGDVFVHHSVIRAEGYRSLDEGQRVRFVVRVEPKGLEAQEVELVPVVPPSAAWTQHRLSSEVAR